MLTDTSSQIGCKSEFYVCIIRPSGTYIIVIFLIWKFPGKRTWTGGQNRKWYENIGFDPLEMRGQ